MKTLLTFLLVIFFTLTSSAQDISDVKQIGSTIITLTSNGSEIGRRTLNDRESLSGFSTSIVVITYDNRTAICCDQKFKEISRMTLNDGDIVKNVNGDNILIKRSGIVITYDKYFKEVSRRNE